MRKPEMLEKMKGPGDSRGANFGVCQIAITSTCDNGKCSNCTQLMPYRGNGFMSLENVKAAIRSVSDYPGVVGIFGGNPCLHPEFVEICKYLQPKNGIPYERRGLWTNNLNGHGKIIRNTFGYHNFNCHCDEQAGNEMGRMVPKAKIWGRNGSDHGAVLVSMQDAGLQRGKRNELISQCDVNQRWSPVIMEIKGKLQGFFCEIAGAFAHARGDTDTGVDIEPGWWRRPMEDVEHQVDRYCHDCGVPMRLAGGYDYEETDTVSEGYKDWSDKRGRHTREYDTEDLTQDVTDYEHPRS